MDIPALLDRAFGHVAQARIAGELAGSPSSDAGLQQALVQLLLDHRELADPRAVDLAGVVAFACTGSRHLWQDLGLSGREEVTALLGWAFPALVARNVKDWKWKRFLFAELGAQLGMPNLQPPKCSGCDSYHQCVGAIAAPGIDQTPTHSPSSAKGKP